MGQLIVKAFLSYLDSHPELIEQVVQEVITALMAELAKVTAPK